MLTAVRSKNRREEFSLIPFCFLFFKFDGCNEFLCPMPPIELACSRDVARHSFTISYLKINCDFLIILDNWLIFSYIFSLSKGIRAVKGFMAASAELSAVQLPSSTDFRLNYQKK